MGDLQAEQVDQLVNSLQLMDPHIRLAVLIGNLDTYRKLKYLNNLLMRQEGTESKTS